MAIEDVPRKDLDNKDFLNFRQTTEKIAGFLGSRLKSHLSTLKPLFFPQKLLGSYIKGSSNKDVPGSDKAFAKLQQRYAAICESPFDLRKELSVPLPTISSQLTCTPYQYDLKLADDTAKTTTITSPTKFVLSYESECSLNRLKAIIAGTETRRAEDMKQSLLNHICMTIILEQIPALRELLKDLRYQVQTHALNDLGGLSVVVLSLPIQTFLPEDTFIAEVTQLSGIPAFQEIIDFKSVDTMADPLRDAFGTFLQ